MKYLFFATIISSQIANILADCEAVNSPLTIDTNVWTCDPSCGTDCECIGADTYSGSACPSSELFPSGAQCGGNYRGFAWAERRYDLTNYQNPVFSMKFKIWHHCPHNPNDCIAMAYSCDGTDPDLTNPAIDLGSPIDNHIYRLELPLTGCAGKSDVRVRAKELAQDMTFNDVCIEDIPVSFYQMGPTGVSFNEAEAYCVGIGEQLGSLHSAEDWQRAKAACTSTNGCWFGLHQDLDSGGVWQYTDESVTDYGFEPCEAGTCPITGVTPWRPLEPNDFSGEEACVTVWMIHGGGWNDDKCHSILYNPLCSAPPPSYFKFYVSSISGSQTDATVEIRLQLDGKVYSCMRGPLAKSSAYTCPFYDAGTTITTTTVTDTINKITFINDHTDAPYIYRVQVVDVLGDRNWDIYQSFCLATEYHLRVGWYSDGHSRMDNPCECSDGGIDSFDSGAILIDNDFSFPVVSVLLDSECTNEGRVVVANSASAKVHQGPHIDKHVEVQTPRHEYHYQPQEKPNVGPQQPVQPVAPVDQTVNLLWLVLAGVVMLNVIACAIYWKKQDPPKYHVTSLYDSSSQSETV